MRPPLQAVWGFLSTLRPALMTLARDGRHHRLLAALVVLPASVWAGNHASEVLSLLPYATIAAAVVWLRAELALPALLLALACVPFEIGTGTASAINVALLGVAAMTGVWWLRMAVARRICLRPSEANLPWLVLTVVAGLALLAAPRRVIFALAAIALILLSAHTAGGWQSGWLPGLLGVLFAGLLDDWVLPFVYNAGLYGSRDSVAGWPLLRGLVFLRATRRREAA